MKIVIDITEEIYKDICDNGYIFDEDSEDIAKAIKNGTSVEPEITNDDLQAAMTESYHLGYELAETKFKRPQGEWIFHKDYNERKYGCNQCGNLNNIPSNFCPNCGAKMEADNE